MEKIFIRCTNVLTKDVWMNEVEAEFAFEVNGYRFFFHDGQITDGLTGQVIARPIAFDTKKALIDRTEERLKKHFDKYLEGVKKRKRANWRAIRY